MQDLIASLDKLQKSIQPLELMQEVLEVGRDIIADELSRLILPHDLRTYEIENVEVDITADGIGNIIMTSDHAAFVEFGTGVVREGRHPLEGSADIDYEKGATGKTSMTFKKGGNYYTTVGMPSRPFLYNAKRRLEQRYAGLIKVELKYDRL